MLIRIFSLDSSHFIIIIVVMIKNIEQKEDELSAWDLVKRSLQGRSYTLGKLAREHGVYKSNFISLKHTPCPHFEKLLADFLGLNPWELWPHRYRGDRKPAGISLRYRPVEFRAERIKKIRERKEKNVGEIEHEPAGV